MVPANSFAEYDPEPNPETKKKDVVWFALNEDQPVFAFRPQAAFDLDRGNEIEASSRTASSVWLSDHRAERGGRADASQV